MTTENKATETETETQYDTPDPLDRKRNGKIARLNRDIRESLNLRIQKQHPTEEILEWLNAEPAVKAVLQKEFNGQPISRHNLAQWCSRGYRDWEEHQCAYLRVEKRDKKTGGKQIDANELGNEIARLHAAQYMATLDDLVATASNAEERMKRLSKAMVEIRGWRRADYHAERMAFDKQKWQHERQKELDAQEKEEQKIERRRVTAWLLRAHRRQGQPPSWLDTLMDGQHDIDILYEMQRWAWKAEDEIASKKEAGSNGNGGQEAEEKGGTEPAKAGEAEPVTCSVQPSTAAGLANGEKPAVDNQGLVHPVTVGNSEKIESPVSGMSDKERKEFYKKYLGMLLDLNAAGEDLRKLGGYADAERKHAALKNSPESEVQSLKLGDVEAKVQHSTFNVQPSAADSDAEMSSEERREMGARTLEMLYDLFHGGEDILAIESHDELLEKHAALKAKKEEALTTAGKAGEEHNNQQPIPHGAGNIQHPEKGGETPNTKDQTLNNNQTSNTNVESLNSGVVESGNGKPQSDALRSDAADEAALPGSENPQPSTKDTQPVADGPMTIEQANKVVDEWYQKARRLGGIVVNSWDVADLRAYLSQQPAAYYSLKTGKHEFRDPPARDPRFDSASPWSKAWPYLEAERRANEKN